MSLAGGCPYGLQAAVCWWALVVALVAVAVYSQTLVRGFVYDNNAVVAGNALIRSLGGVLRIFSPTEWSGAGIEVRQYRPFTGATYAFNDAFTGLTPWSYHLLNVLLHVAVLVCVFFLGLRWGLGLALWKLHKVRRTGPILALTMALLLLIPIGTKLLRYYRAPNENDGRTTAAVLHAAMNGGDVLIFTGCGRCRSSIICGILGSSGEREFAENLRQDDALRVGYIPGRLSGCRELLTTLGSRVLQLRFARTSTIS